LGKWVKKKKSRDYFKKDSRTVKKATGNKKWKLAQGPKEGKEVGNGEMRDGGVEAGNVHGRTGNAIKIIGTEDQNT